MIVVAQLSDTHIDGERRNSERLARVMNYLNGLQPRIDAILVTGDVADNGEVAEYEQARATLATDVPLLYCPGNHDDRAAFRKVLLGHRDQDAAGTGPINQVHEIAGATFLMCDSTIPRRGDGVLADETLDWLRATLAATDADARIFLAFHHPPVELFSPIVDPIRLGNPEALAAVVADDPRIVAILCGHAHTAATTTFAGVPVVVAPSTSSVLGTDWEGGGPAGGIPVVDYSVPPTIAFHLLEDSGRLTTHFRVVTESFADNGYVPPGHVW